MGRRLHADAGRGTRGESEGPELARQTNKTQWRKQGTVISAVWQPAAVAAAVTCGCSARTGGRWRQTRPACCQIYHGRQRDRKLGCGALIQARAAARGPADTRFMTRICIQWSSDNGASPRNGRLGRQEIQVRDIFRTLKSSRMTF